MDNQEYDQGTIIVTNVVEREDGGADYTFDLDEKTAIRMANLGLELTLYCAAFEVDIQEVLDWIKTQGATND